MIDLKEMTKPELEQKLNAALEEIDELKKQRQYGLIWEEQKNTEAESIFPIIKEVKEREIITDGNGPANLLIEGDNLHSLSVLLHTHKGRIGLTYIDPPYSTGNNGFTYNDLFANKDNTWRHSKWLSFMAKRLRLAKELLSEDGVIFISIDDNEQAQLKLLCDQIFGEENHLITTLRKTKTMTGDDGSGLNLQHDFLIGYAKDKSKVKFTGDEKDFSSYKNPDNDPNGPWVNSDPTAKSGSKSTYFPITNPNTGTVDYPSKGRYWAFSENTMKEYIRTGRITFKENLRASERGFIFKRYKNNLMNAHNPVDSLIFTQSNNYLNSNGTSEVRNILHENKFSYPKPLKFLKSIIEMYPSKDMTVLDFFAGSGTTGHAVLELNKEDGGNRQFILCTNNENNICEEVTYERLKRVINGYTTPKGKKIESLGGNLKYYKTVIMEED